MASCSRWVLPGIPVVAVLLAGWLEAAQAAPFDLDTARAMAAMSKAAYASPTQLEATVQGLGYEPPQVLDGTVYAAQDRQKYDPSTRAVLTKTVKNGKTVYVLAFRGTQVGNINNYITDASIGKLPLSPTHPGAQVHAGFLKVSNLGMTALEPLLDAIRSDPASELIITGHSLGGAAAEVLGARLVDAGVPPAKFSVYSFGAPAVGTEGFVRSYDGRFSAYRVHNPKDPISGSVALGALGFRHVGQDIGLSEGRLSLDPAQNFLQGVQGTIENLTNQVGALTGSLPPGVTPGGSPGQPNLFASHSIDEYQRLLAANLQVDGPPRPPTTLTADRATSDLVREPPHSLAILGGPRVHLEDVHMVSGDGH
jgi:hypothetical protein